MSTEQQTAAEPSLAYWLRHLEAQLEVALDDADGPYNQLTELFASLIKTIQQQDSHPELADQVRQAVIAFQFYDRMHQRMTHVRDGMSKLARLAPNADLADTLELEQMTRPGSLYSDKQAKLVQEFAANTDASIEEIRAMVEQLDTGNDASIELF